MQIPPSNSMQNILRVRHDTARGAFLLASAFLAVLFIAAFSMHFDLPTFKTVGDNTSAIIQEGSMMVAGVLLSVGQLLHLRFSEGKKSGFI